MDREFGKGTYPFLMMSEAITRKLKGWGLGFSGGSFAFMLTLIVSWGLAKARTLPCSFSVWLELPHNWVDGFQGQIS